MPVIIGAADVENWLGDDAEAAAGLMRPASDDLQHEWLISRRVNDIRQDESGLLEPVAIGG